MSVRKGNKTRGAVIPIKDQQNQDERGQSYQAVQGDVSNNYILRFEAPNERHMAASIVWQEIVDAENRNSTSFIIDRGNGKEKDNLKSSTLVSDTFKDKHSDTVAIATNGENIEDRDESLVTTISEENIEHKSTHPAASTTRTEVDSQKKEIQAYARLKAKEANLSRLRWRNLKSRGEVAKMRHELRSSRLQVFAADERLIKIIRNTHIQSFESTPDHNVLEECFRELKAARDKYALLEESCDALQERLDREEYDATQLEKQLLTHDLDLSSCTSDSGNSESGETDIFQDSVPESVSHRITNWLLRKMRSSCTEFTLLARIKPEEKDREQKSIRRQVYSKVAGYQRKAVRLLLNGKECTARPDSGSNLDIMTEDFAKQHGIIIQREESCQGFLMGNGEYIKSIGRAYVPCRLVGDSQLEEHRWFHVLANCVVPLIVGMEFIQKTKLFTCKKHLLVDCPASLLRMPTLKWIGSPQGRINFVADGNVLLGFADTGSDLDLMSLKCAIQRGFKIDRRQSARTRVMLPDCSTVNTVGQVHISSVKVGPFDSFKMSFHVLPGLPCDVIFGEEFVEQMDAFNTCFEIMNLEDPYLHSLYTLINLGPIQTFLSRRWAPATDDTPQKKHDDAMEAEIYRRNMVNRSIAGTPDQMSVAEVARRRAFDSEHRNCVYCIGKRPERTA